jgi:hypothetical protein
MSVDSRLRWTPELDRYLATAWRHALQTGGTAADIAGELGISTSRVRGRLTELRKRWGVEVVPPGSPGRPPDRTLPPMSEREREAWRAGARLAWGIDVPPKNRPPEEDDDGQA